MKTSWVFILLACSSQLTSAVNLVVIRDDDSASKSVEDEDEQSDESSDSDESRDIDMLVDLIEKSTHQRKTPPMRSVRVVRRKPASKTLASTRKERIQQSPKQPKEYHVHYHTYQHPKPPEGAVFEEDRLKPMLWESLASHLNTYQDIYKRQKAPLMSLSAAERFKQFRDFETLLQTKNRTPEFGTGPKFYDGSDEFPDHFDDAIVQHPPAPKVKTTNELNLERLKRYQALLNSRFRTQSQKTRSSKENDDDFPNRERFAGFTDFSALEESSQPKQPSRPKEVQKPKEDKGKEGDDLEIRDFAIVIKTPRIVPQSIQKDAVYNGDGKDVLFRMRDKPTNIPPDDSRNGKDVSYRMRDRPNALPEGSRSRRPFSVPRILDSPGGAPQFIEKLNQAKFVKSDKQNPNSIESQQRQRFLMRPGLRPDLGSHVYNGWIIQRWLR